MDAFAWAEDAKDRPEVEFGERLCFAVLLDGVGADNLTRCRSVVRSMPGSDLASGFVGSKAVLSAWPRHELF